MGGPPPLPPQEDDSEAWMFTFADMVTLVMTFFILLLSMSTIDAAKYEDVKKAMSESVSKTETKTPIEDLRVEVEQAVKAVQFDEHMSIGKDDNGLVVEFASGAFFKPGAAEVVDEAKPALLKIAATLAAPRFSNFQIEVQGHTDDDPIHTVDFPSNWELSAERATSVIRVLETLTVDAPVAPPAAAPGAAGAPPAAQPGAPTQKVSAIARERFRAVGFADVVPKVPNRGPSGQKLVANQEINRRIVIRLIPTMRRTGGFDRPRTPAPAAPPAQ